VAINYRIFRSGIFDHDDREACEQEKGKIIIALG